MDRSAPSRRATRGGRPAARSLATQPARSSTIKMISPLPLEAAQIRRQKYHRATIRRLAARPLRLSCALFCAEPPPPPPPPSIDVGEATQAARAALSIMIVVRVVVVVVGLAVGDVDAPSRGELTRTQPQTAAAPTEERPKARALRAAATISDRPDK